MQVTLEAALREGHSWSIRTDYEDATRRVGGHLAEFLAGEVSSRRSGVVVVLVGTLGAGKTRFVQGMVEALGGDKSVVVSPTFVLRRDYDTEAARLFHFDLYRLETATDFARLGPDECFEDDAITVIEWGDKFPELLPSRFVKVSIEIVNSDTRDIKIEWQL
ncbi:MAG: tRNA (adenosine(37)-N6)-threonylcarbamoyltransferase complex ATPase subunit type 1 TsaE [Thermoguttaceae bacterium]